MGSSLTRDRVYEVVRDDVRLRDMLIMFPTVPAAEDEIVSLWISSG